MDWNAACSTRSAHGAARRRGRGYCANDWRACRSMTSGPSRRWRAGGLEANAESAAAWRRRAVRCGKELAGLDAERAANADVDGRRRFLAETGRCGRPTTDGSRWCAAHVDLWARGAAHAVGLWRSPEVLYGDVVDFRPPMPVSADEMRQWAKSTADLLRLGFGALDEKEARRWSTPPSL